MAGNVCCIFFVHEKETYPHGGGRVYVLQRAPLDQSFSKFLMTLGT